MLNTEIETFKINIGQGSQSGVFNIYNGDKYSHWIDNSELKSLMSLDIRSFNAECEKIMRQAELIY